MVSQNDLTELPYAGISIGWRWDRTPVGVAGNVVELNHVHHVALVLADTGGIYSIGDQQGGRICSNYVHHITRFHGIAGNHGIFFDNGNVGWHLEGNVFHDIADGVFRFNDNNRADHTWGTNYFDLKPGEADFPTALVNRIGRPGKK